MKKIKLTESEEKTLHEGYRNHSKAHFRLRCHSLLLLHEGKSVKEIAGLAKTRTRTVYSWLDRWETVGIVGLTILSGRGVKSKLCIDDENMVDIIKKN